MLNNCCLSSGKGNKICVINILLTIVFNKQLLYSSNYCAKLLIFSKKPGVLGAKKID